MGKSRDGSVRKKVAGTSLRYSSEHQAQRIAMLIEYVNFVGQGSKMTFQDITDALLADLDMTFTQLAKIKQNMIKDGVIDENGEINEAKAKEHAEKNS